MSFKPTATSPKVVLIMPAFNAASTLHKTLQDIPDGCVDEIILTDDASSDDTVKIARENNLFVLEHEQNKGYGANQKTCYDAALQHGADIVIMMHPDYQYDARIIPHAVGFLQLGICDVVLGCRVRSRRETLQGGMPVYKYISNRVLNIIENVILGQNIGDFHTGFRAYTRQVLETIPYQQNSDDFVFDSEFLAQCVFCGFSLGDVPIPTRYFKEASSINFKRSLTYGLQTLQVMFKFLLQQSKIKHFNIFPQKK